MKQIDIIIKPDGTVNIEALGFVGNSCEKATKELENVFAVSSKTKKPEYYATKTTSTQNRVGQG